MRIKHVQPRRVEGFSLIELAIGLAILALLAGGAMMALSVQRDVEREVETRKTLELAREALIGYAMKNDRLPCPATVTSNGQEAPAGGGACSIWNGFLPAATLGLGGSGGYCGGTSVAGGYLLDGWGNCIRYAVSNASANAATTVDGITLGYNPDLRICTDESCTTMLTGSNNVVAVLFSTGKTGASAPGGAHESENLDTDQDFVVHEQRPNGAAGGEFDHEVTWLPITTLISKLVTAGRLP